jgi:hypothetical protein
MVEHDRVKLTAQSLPKVRKPLPFGRRQGSEFVWLDSGTNEADSCLCVSLGVDDIEQFLRMTVVCARLSSTNVCQAGTEPSVALSILSRTSLSSNSFPSVTMPPSVQLLEYVGVVMPF